MPRIKLKNVFIILVVTLLASIAIIVHIQRDAEPSALPTEAASEAPDDFERDEVTRKYLLGTYRTESDVQDNHVAFKQIQKNLQYKLVHLDLKGAPPKLSYLTATLPMLREAGATGLLIEYEDMFPYDADLKHIRAGNAYERDEAFLITARSYDFEIVPLVQTFGHLEFVLKLKEFRELREVDSFPDSICPTKERSFRIIAGMIDQVVRFHSKVSELNWLHIGCDEVYRINKCDDCIKKNVTDKRMFVDHVKKIADYVKTKYPNVMPLIWDDMLRGFLPNELTASGLGRLVQPVVWIYSKSINDLVSHRIWYHYAKTFSGLWIASAFKGASGATQTLPDLYKYYQNNLAWMKFATSYKSPSSFQKYNFLGVILTGWSRYHHFSVLCETLPVSIPSLMLNLLLINLYIAEIARSHIENPTKIQNSVESVVFVNWLHLIKCYGTIGSNGPKNAVLFQNMERNLHMCSFKGNALYADFLNLLEIEKITIKFHISTAFKENGYLFYNVDYKSISNNRNTLNKANRLSAELTALSNNLIKHSQGIFDNHTIAELIQYKIRPLNDIVGRVLNASKLANDIKHWKSRPFS